MDSSRNWCLWHSHTLTLPCSLVLLAPHIPLSFCVCHPSLSSHFSLSWDGRRLFTMQRWCLHRSGQSGTCVCVYVFVYVCVCVCVCVDGGGVTPWIKAWSRRHQHTHSPSHLPWGPGVFGGDWHIYLQWTTKTEEMFAEKNKTLSSTLSLTVTYHHLTSQKLSGTEITVCVLAEMLRCRIVWVY